MFTVEEINALEGSRWLTFSSLLTAAAYKEQLQLSFVIHLTWNLCSVKFHPTPQQTTPLCLSRQPPHAKP